MLPLTILNLIVLSPLVAFQVGSCCVPMDRIDAPGIAEWVRNERIGHFSGVPTIFHDLLTPTYRNRAVSKCGLQFFRRLNSAGNGEQLILYLWARTFGFRNSDQCFAITVHEFGRHDQLRDPTWSM